MRLRGLTFLQSIGQSLFEGEAVVEVARRYKKTPGAVYMARFKVMQRLKEKVLEVSEVWSDVK